MILRRFVALASLVLLIALPSAASSVRVDFSGSIDQVFDPTLSLLPQFGAGAPFAGSFELDPALATLLPGLPVDVYAFPLTTDPAGPSALSGQVVLAGVTLGLSPFPAAGINGIGVFDDLVVDTSTVLPVGVYDAYLVPYLGAPLLGTFAPAGSTGSCGMGLADSTAASFTGGFFVPPDLGAFDIPFFSCNVVLSDGSVLVDVTGTITSWVVTPEPSLMVLLVASACLGWFCLRLSASRCHPWVGRIRGA